MTVVQPNSISGINSITVQSGEGLSIHKSDGSLIREIVSAAGIATYDGIKVGTAGTISNIGNAALAGIVTANGGVIVGAAATIYANGNATFSGVTTAKATDLQTGPLNVGTAATISANGNATFSGIVTATSFVGSGANLTGIPALTGSTNNTLVTVTGSNAIAGEANLTYDGTNLDLVTDANNEGIRAISNGNSYPVFELDSDRGGAGNTIGKLVSKWNNTAVASIQFITGTDTTNKDDAYIVFNTASAGTPTERVRITTTGLVGIGTDAPGETLEVGLGGDIKLKTGVSAATTKRIYALGGTGSYSVGSSGGSAVAFVRDASNNDAIAFETHVQGSSHAERMRLDSSGRLIIGHTATDDRDGYDSSLQVSGTGGDDSSVSIGRWSGDASAAGLVLSKSRNGTIGSHTVVQANDLLGVIQFQGDDGTNYHAGAQIQAKVESGVGNDDIPTSLLFATNAGGTGTTTALTIDSSQNATFAGTVSDSKGELRTLTVNAKGSDYTLVVGDAGKFIRRTGGNVTIPDDVFSTGNMVTILNDAGSSMTITAGTGFSLYNTADAATGSRTLAARGMATILFNSTEQGYISGAGLS